MQTAALVASALFATPVTARGDPDAVDTEAELRAAWAEVAAPESQSRLGRIHLVHDGHRRLSVARVLGLASIAALTLLAVTPGTAPAQGGARAAADAPNFCKLGNAAGPGRTSVLTLSVRHTGCATGKRLVRAYHDVPDRPGWWGWQLRPARGRLPLQRAPPERGTDCIQGAGQLPRRSATSRAPVHVVRRRARRRGHRGRAPCRVGGPACHRRSSSPTTSSCARASPAGRSASRSAR